MEPALTLLNGVFLKIFPSLPLVSAKNKLLIKINNTIKRNMGGNFFDFNDLEICKVIIYSSEQKFKKFESLVIYYKVINII